MNTTAVLHFAFETEEFTAAEAMAETELTRATVLGVCADLVAAGWLEEVADSRAAGLSSRGRPARRYRLRESAGLVVGVDAGEHRVHVVVVNLRGRELASREQETAPDAVDARGRVELVRELINTVLREARHRDDDVLLTVVGVPAPVDDLGNSPEGEGTFWPLMNPGFATALRGSVVVENDANLAALAEQAREPLRNVATLLTGERLGSGLIVDGLLLRGKRGGAGEMRVLDVLSEVEMSAEVRGADGLGKQARMMARTWLRRTSQDSLLRDLPPEQVGAAEVFRAAAAGDALAQRILERLAERLARIVVVLESLLDVERVVVAGDTAKSLEPVLEHTRAVLEAEYYPPFPDLVASTLGARVVVDGALEYGLSRVREVPFLMGPQTAQD
jgi:predicted NBD/HSP70 family sugar kinase